jgi:hypothetical protein
MMARTRKTRGWALSHCAALLPLLPYVLSFVSAFRIHTLKNICCRMRRLLAFVGIHLPYLHARQRVLA